jgi:Arc/MetJ-type ribon-helix-helix transcriptional regulator
MHRFPKKRVLTCGHSWITLWITIHSEIFMKTIQMTIDEPLLDEVDHVIQDLKTTRSAFIRSALQLALRKHAISKLEQQHTEGYARHPVAPGEFDIWEPERAWGER